MEPNKKHKRIYEAIEAPDGSPIDDYGRKMGIDDKSESTALYSLEMPKAGPIGSIRDSAYANVNVPTRSIRYTDNGNLGCAAAVSIIFYRATGYTIVPGKKLELSTSGMWTALSTSSNWQKIDNWQSGYKPGDIILTARGSRPGHVGVVVDNGNVISNSSGGFEGDRKGQIEANYTVARWKSVAARNPQKTALFRYVGPFRSTWNGPETSRGESNSGGSSNVSNAIVVFGGLNYATADWMRKQWTESIGEPGRNVIFEEYTTSLADVKSKNPGIKISALIGFSAGARQVWPHIGDSSIKFIGLIDPSTRRTDWGSDNSIPDRVKIMSNSGNWVKYQNTYDAIQELEQSGKSEYIKIGHSKIPAEFFKKYKSELSIGSSSQSSSQDTETTDVLNIKYGSKGSAVVDLQRALISSGYDLPKYGVDGKFYKETQGALKRFQKDKGLEETGELDSNTKDLLFNSSDETSVAPKIDKAAKKKRFKIFDKENRKIVIARFVDDNTISIKSRLGSNLGTAIRTSSGIVLEYDGKEIPATEESTNQVARSVYRIFNRVAGAVISSGTSSSDDSDSSSGSTEWTSGTAKKGAQIALKLVNDLGITREQAAGIVGNLWAESGLIPDRIQGPGVKRGTISQASGGYGWAQWTYPTLKTGFIDHARSKGLDITTYPATDDINYSYLVKWISNSPAKLRELKSTRGVKDSAEYFAKRYEKPADQSQAKLDKRTGFGNQVLAAMGSSSARDNFNDVADNASGSKNPDNNRSSEKIKVLFVGDSQTAASYSYANKLIQSGRVQGKVIAQVGANTSIIKDMLAKELQSGNKYDVISIMGGGNDAWRAEPSVPISNLSAMYQIAKNSGAKVVAISNPSKKNKKDKIYPSNDSIAAWVERGGPADGNIADVKLPINSTLSLESNFSPDKIHLNGSAHNRIALEFENKVLG